MAGRPRRRALAHAGFPTTRKLGFPQRGCNTNERNWKQDSITFATDCSLSKVKSAGLIDELTELLEDHAFQLNEWHWHVPMGRIITDQSDHFAIRSLCSSGRQIVDTQISWRNRTPSSRGRRN